ncbi:MAG: HEAT repeat domain-containing protein [Planctomycetes bacterium]|nr:HEAT repeat domain-containing protein [Planctomycetota bacterium]
MMVWILSLSALSPSLLSAPAPAAGEIIERYLALPYPDGDTRGEARQRRLAALEKLGAVPAEAVPAIAAALPRVADPLRREELAEALRTFPGRPAADILIGLLKDPSPLVRNEAVQVLRLFSRRVDRFSGKRTLRNPALTPKVDGLVPHLIAAARDPAEIVRETAVYALADACDPAATDELRAHLDDESPHVRLRAACLLTEFRDASGLPEMRKALERLRETDKSDVRRLFEAEMLFASFERITGKSFGPIPLNPLLLSISTQAERSERRYEELLDTWAAWWAWEPEADDGGDTVWEGYLFRDEEGRLRIGWAVIAMGVMAQPPHVVAGDLADRLAPFVSCVEGDYFFWNYAWFGDLARPAPEPKTDPARVPRFLVRLRGDIEPRGSEGPLVMERGRLLSVESLSEGWLRAWIDTARLGFDPLSGDPRGASEERERAIAPKALDLLIRLREQSRVTDAMREAARRVHPRARAEKRFQGRIEGGLHRWIAAANARYRLDLAGLDALGAPPPDGASVVARFLAAKDKEAFLEGVRAVWPGEPGEIDLPIYIQPEPQSTVYHVFSLDEVESWSDEEFLRRQAFHRDHGLK